MDYRRSDLSDFTLSPPEHSDECVAARASSGCRTAFAELVRRHVPGMRARARAVLPGTIEVDDAVQDAIIVAWHKLPELKEPAKARVWLERIAARKAIDRLRASAATTNFDDGIRESSAASSLAGATNTGYSPAESVEMSAALGELRRVLRTLPDIQRECWVLREIDGYSYAELATELQVSPSTVRGVLARARRSVAAGMEAWRD